MKQLVIESAHLEGGSSGRFGGNEMGFLIYFDESYDNKITNHYFLQGALFCPHPHPINNLMRGTKRFNGYYEGDDYKEIKYRDCVDEKSYEVYRSAIDIFTDSTAWFRCIVVDLSPGFDLDRFGDPAESDKMKKARMYKRFAELLIRNNVGSVRKAVLLTDRMSRTPGDEFIDLMKTIFGQPAPPDNEPVIREAQEVDFKLEQFQIGQLCDLLLGCVLGSLIEPKANVYKKAVTQHLAARMGIPSFKPDYWLGLSRHEKDDRHSKFQVWHWRPR